MGKAQKPVTAKARLHFSSCGLEGVITVTNGDRLVFHSKFVGLRLIKVLLAEGALPRKMAKNFRKRIKRSTLHIKDPGALVTIRHMQALQALDQIRALH